MKKKDWETYDVGAGASNPNSASNPTRSNGDGTTSDPNANANTNVLFDIDAIRAEIEASGREEQLSKNMDHLKMVQQLPPSTLAPPDLAGLRHTKSFDAPPFAKRDSISSRGCGSDIGDGRDHRGGIEKAGSGKSPPAHSSSASTAYGGYGGGENVWADYDEYEGEGEMQMTFA